MKTQMNRYKNRSALASFGSLVVAALLGSTVRAELVEAYVGIDSRAKLTSGTYAGKDNPNFGRLTYLYAHGFPENPVNNHYHGIGSYTLIGPANAPVATNSNAGNRIPEVYTQLPPLTLVPTTNAAYAGHLVSDITAEHYSTQRIRSVQDLAKYGFGAAEWYMFNSSGGTRTNRMDGAIIALELVAKTPGLNIGAGDNPSLLVNPGDRLTLGEGNTVDFLPTYSVLATAAPSTYSASFKFVDIGSGEGYTKILESGVFHLDFQVAPAPSIAIQPTVTLSVPMVTAGYVLESAPKADGPWTKFVASPQPEYTGSGESRVATGKAALTVPVGSTPAFFRYRKE